MKDRQPVVFKECLPKARNCCTCNAGIVSSLEEPSDQLGRLSIDSTTCIDCAEKLLKRLQKRRDRALKEAEVARVVLDDYVVEWEEECVDAHEDDIAGVEDELDTLIQQTAAQLREARRSRLKKRIEQLELVEAVIQQEEAEREASFYTSEIARLSAVNIVNEVFRIWYTGPFGTINGLRLGRTPSAPVPWSEVNAACGQVLFLLQTLIVKHGVTLERHRLCPLGSCSRILTLPEKRPLLLFYPQSTAWSKGRSAKKFDQALNGLLQCLYEFTSALGQTGRLPFKISGLSIGGAPIQRLNSDDPTWTRACKYMLADLKWLTSLSMQK